MEMNVYDAVVYESLDGSMKLTSYDEELDSVTGPILLGPGPVIGGTGLDLSEEQQQVGGWNTVDMTDPTQVIMVSSAATFAFEEISKQINTKLEYIGYRNVRNQVVNGIRYRFDLVCTQFDMETAFDAIVYLAPGKDEQGQLQYTLEDFTQLYIRVDPNQKSSVDNKKNDPSNLDFTICGDGNMLINQFSTTVWPPKKGEMCLLSFKGTTENIIDAGHWTVTMTWNGAIVTKETGQLCDTLDSDCPTHANTIGGTIAFKMPDVMESGIYNIKIQAKNDDNLLLCYEIPFNI